MKFGHCNYLMSTEFVLGTASNEHCLLYSPSVEKKKSSVELIFPFVLHFAKWNRNRLFEWFRTMTICQWINVFIWWSNFQFSSHSLLLLKWAHSTREIYLRIDCYCKANWNCILFFSFCGNCFPFFHIILLYFILFSFSPTVHKQKGHSSTRSRGVNISHQWTFPLCVGIEIILSREWGAVASQDVRVVAINK